jgi:phosphoribosylformylglycinamidine (FGAM) synthase-like enzyme
VVVGCKAPSAVKAQSCCSEAFSTSTDTTTIASMQWRNFFTNKNLQNLIDTALKQSRVADYITGN